MPRPQRPLRVRRGAPVDEAIWLWLLDGERPSDDMDLFMLDGQGDAPNSQLRKLWEGLGDAVTATYASLHPGRRPRVWWRLQAPEPRRRLGGRGTPASALLAYVPSFEYGIPSGWLLDDWHWTHDGEKPPAAYVPFDRAHPPTFEAQAAYLKRLKLLLPGEERRLKAADFELESVDPFRSEPDPGPSMTKTLQPGA
jgi:hypothetical protein